VPNKSNESRVVFTDGYVADKNFVAVATYLEEYEDSEHARIFAFKEGEWSYFDLDFNVRSIQGVESPGRMLYCLGQDGRVSVRKKGGPVEEKIKDAGSAADQLGYLHQIRLIGSTLYACGVANQIYRRTKSGWVHFDEGVLDRRGPLKADTLFCVDGSSEEDVYAVGTAGQVWHHDGKSWQKTDAPTPRNLKWVRCLSRNELYVCGDDGRFFQRTKNEWADLSASPKITGDLWCVEVFQKKVYVAGDSGLFVLEGKKLVKVDTGFDSGEGHRLHANDGVLWSFGISALCFFDGKKWTEVKHPDNS